ncbi:unnamed protein product [Clonostachys solani]|uniref:GH16 domain-containing protein n=1 Tax=Clonostachys solani TaxID=160281 RepID=A0A9N9ZN82_9HYPO|nr:unnamed protein product [Clonostachys solani]
MGWKDHLKSLKQEFDSIMADPSEKKNDQQPQQSQAQPQGQAPLQSQQEEYQAPPFPPPPPIPASQIYWQPQFRPELPTNVEWDAKLGNGPDGWGNQELQHYTADPANSFHTQDGRLVVRALANSGAPTPEQRYTSARLVSRETLGYDRGVLTAVILSPSAEGIWPAFWLLPKEPFSWPTDGEVDIAESYNGDRENKSCLHWGFHHEPQKHRVLATSIPDMGARNVRYDFVWDQPGGQAGQGRMVWYVDGRAVMKHNVPEGTRPLRDMTILLNVAMGGNVCKGKIPADGYYDMVVQSLFTASDPDQGGWQRFEADWHNSNTPLGNTY